jgi:energy-coupling factor transporter ATP-binding protein EcfA2
MFEIHSAGVVAPNTGAGVLIVGPSGSGKSTLTLQLAHAGWGYQSDDELLLSLNGEEVEARGFRSFFALANAAAGANGEMKTCFEPSDILAAPRIARAKPRFVLFTAIGDTDETYLRELTQPEIMTRLIRACPWATYDTAIAGANLQLLSRLARQVKGFDLRAGTDLLDPHRASQIIGSLTVR